MIRFMVVTHEMEERFILKKYVLYGDKRELLFPIFIEFQVLKSCDDGPLLLFFFFAAQVLSYEFCHNTSFRLYFVMLFKENNTN